MPPRFVENPFKLTFDHKKQMFIMEWPDGERRVVPVDVLRAEHEIVERALAEYDAQAGSVLPPERQTKVRH